MRHGTGVLIIGGGPAGLAAAIAARRKGFEVTVIDGARPPIEKACGEGLMPNTLAALRELGIAIHPDDCGTFRGIRFIDGADSAEARFPGFTGIGVRRTVLHQRMVKEAQERGVALLWNTPASGLTQERATAGGTLVKAQWIIGADGICSRVRRWSGLERGLRQEVRFAQRRRYRVKPWTDCVEIHWGQEMQAYVTPLGGDEICVVLISRDPRMRWEEAWRHFPVLEGNLSGAELSSTSRGAVTATSSLNRVYRGNVALTGDASGSVDAVTGEGLGLSFRQAIALADALAAGKLERYQCEHRRLLRQPRSMARLLLLLDRHPSLRKRAIRGFARDPELFSHLLTVHQGETSPRILAAASMRFGWQFLTA